MSRRATSCRGVTRTRRASRRRTTTNLSTTAQRGR
jgi:hypothetical protein